MLSQAEYWYNTSFHSSMGCSPFHALYGYDPSNGYLQSTNPSSDSVHEMVQTLQTQAKVLREHLAKAQNKMKMAADKKRVDKEYQVGDMVLLKLQPYAQSSLVNRPFPKLSFKYFGPYKVTHKIGRVAYQLDLPTSSQLHPVFHVSQLKSFLPNYTPVFSDLPKVAELDGQDLYPEAVLERRLVKKGNKAVPQALVQWAKLPPHMATCEDWYVLQERCPGVLPGGSASS